MVKNLNTFSYRSQYASVLYSNNTLAYDCLMSDLRKNLQAQLNKKGWNAYDLESACEKIGCRVPQPTIQRFLSGKHGDPRGDTVRKMAKGLGISEAELRGLSKDSPSQKIESDARDIAALMPLASLATQKILQTLERGLEEGRLSQDDITLLETIAKRLVDDKNR